MPTRQPCAATSSTKGCSTGPAASTGGRAGRSRSPSRSLPSIRTHYDVLGVTADADATMIRDAYRERARVHHPDRGGAASATEMAAINEAYRVLGDEARRAVYDLQLEGGSVVYRSTAPDRDGAVPTAAGPRPAPGPPARVPWKLMGAMAAIGIAVVLVGAALREPSPERPPDGVIGPGSCVTIEANNDAREVNCSGDGDLVVEVVVGFDDPCPARTEPHRDQQGLGIACVVTAAAP
ncbi:MAG: J domain-containing protein [Ilumatobacteraceae bacterium]